MSQVDTMDLFDLAERRKKAELETEIRDSIFAHMEESEIRARLLSEIRNALKGIWRQRTLYRGTAAYVTSDDAYELLEQIEGVPDSLSRTFLGATFQTSEWECCGYEKSGREGNHGRLLRKWRLKE